LEEEKWKKILIPAKKMQLEPTAAEKINAILISSFIPGKKMSE
jgi:hypothetical protein